MWNLGAVGCESWTMISLRLCFFANGQRRPTVSKIKLCPRDLHPFKVARCVLHTPLRFLVIWCDFLMRKSLARVRNLFQDVSSRVQISPWSAVSFKATVVANVEMGSRAHVLCTYLSPRVKLGILQCTRCCTLCEKPRGTLSVYKSNTNARSPSMIDSCSPVSMSLYNHIYSQWRNDVFGLDTGRHNRHGCRVQ